MDYNENIIEYRKRVELGVKISKLGAFRISDGNRMTWLCVLHTRICVEANSLLRLAPKEYNPKKLRLEWDYSSMFSLTRNIMECYQTLFYLCSEDISDDERLARKKLFDLHDFSSRKKLFSIINEDFGHEDTGRQIIKELSETSYFKTLEEKKQRSFLKGDSAFFISREDIEERSGNNKETFKYLYKLFSSNTHSYPMGFYGMLEGERGVGLGTKVEVSYSALALSIAGEYVRKSSMNMIELFPDISNHLYDSEKEILGVL